MAIGSGRAGMEREDPGVHKEAGMLPEASPTKPCKSCCPVSEAGALRKGLRNKCDCMDACRPCLMRRKKMKSLQTIQKTFGVMRTLTKVGMILSFVWAGLTALGLVCGVVWYNGGSVVGLDQELLYALTVTGGLGEMIAVLLVDTVFALTDGILLVFALRYFKAEQAEGTPFTKQGADRILHLGIWTIVLPLVASILAAAACQLFDQLHSAGRDWGNLSSLGTGIALILTSLIFRYGAELEEQVK